MNKYSWLPSWVGTEGEAFPSASPEMLSMESLVVSNLFCQSHIDKACLGCFSMGNR